MRIQYAFWRRGSINDDMGCSRVAKSAESRCAATISLLQRILMARNHLFTAKIWQTPRVRRLRHALSVRRLYRNLSAPWRRLPDYIIVGAQKSGTTSLWAYLNEHPYVQPVLNKETNYFDSNYNRGPAWYRSHFPLMKRDNSCATPVSKTLTGESCANYIFHPLAPQRAAETVPRAKIIFLLRNPVDRAFSHYQLKLR